MQQLGAISSQVFTVSVYHHNPSNWNVFIFDSTYSAALNVYNNTGMAN